MTTLDLSRDPRFVTVAALAIFLTVSSGPLADSSLRADESPSLAVRGEVSPGAAEPATPPEIYGEGVRPTSWRSPEAQREGFHLPPGFEIRVFASEPEIAKPLNMALDGRGRMWLTQTTTYPYPAEEGQPRGDAVVLLEDTDGDGRADRVTTFADGLNIPIGVIPYGDGCICYSIPHLWYLRDTTGDGVYDRREKLLGPFDTTRDTHGMVNSLRDGGDGWIYACHGFNNQSEVAGTDGHKVRLQSGNTFRFRPDGSRVEQVTQGQVNPFGMTEDDWGYLYSADCHSKPITQLIRGACYPSFGRPHDGLGFLPPTVDHLHGSTAISGIVFVSERSRIVPLRGQILSGNVMTSRLNRNRLSYQGATARGRELSDFLTSDDPWFRPVDLQLGPDGHLYVADFYNRIIGHYEVPLDHPQRDRTSGRIWQIRYVGESGRPADPTRPAHQGPASGGVVAEQMRELAPAFRDDGWIELADPAAWAETPPERRIAWIRWAAETSPHSLDGDAAGEGSAGEDSEGEGSEGNRGKRLEVFREALGDENPHVRRAAAEALGRVGDDLDVGRLAGFAAAVADGDPVSRQTARIAMRDLLVQADRDSAVWDQIAGRMAGTDRSIAPDGKATIEADASTNRSGEDAARVRAELAFVLAAVDRPEVAAGLLDFLERHPGQGDAAKLLRHAVGVVPAEELGRCVAVARRVAGDSLGDQATLIGLLVEGRESWAVGQPAIRNWGLSLVNEALAGLQEPRHSRPYLVGWSATSASGEGGGWDDRDGAWPRQSRPSAAGPVELMSSHALGEPYRGILRTDAFPAPESIAFRLAGHNGPPDRDDRRLNFVRLVSASTGETLRTAFPPRNDTAITVRWDLADIAGETVRIECVDDDSGSAYAWLAVGDFEPSWLRGSPELGNLRVALDLIRLLRLNRPGSVPSSDASGPGDASGSVMGGLDRLVADGRIPAAWRFSVASLRPGVADSAEKRTLLGAARDIGLAGPPAEQLIAGALDDDHGRWDEITEKLLGRLDSAGQARVARRWLSAGGETGRLLSLAERGWLSVNALSGEAAQMFRARADDDQRQRLEGLVRDRGGATDRTELLARLGRAVQSSGVGLGRGQALFDRHCAACHQLGGRGKVVGPQLDGVVTRTVPRLLEDIVVPDLNVDAAFRTTTFLMEDGQVVVGVVQDESAGRVLVADAEGKTRTLDADAIEERLQSGRSLMPDNFGELLSPQDFAELLAFIRRSDQANESEGGR